MWCDKCKFHIERLDEKMKMFDSGIIIVIQVINVSSIGGIHLEVFKNR